MIRRAYSFSAVGKCLASGHEVDSLCIFFDTKRPITALEFFDELETSLRFVSTLPDSVVVIADHGNLDALHKYWIGTPGQQEVFKQRGFHKGIRFVKGYYFADWHPVDGLKVRHADDVGEAGFELPLDVMIDKGLQVLVETNPVVQVAPAGHVFRHPSRSINKLFIQARELATSEAELAFVGRCIARGLKTLASSDLAKVFIDTMGIYSMVREALWFAKSAAGIHSFHSYSKLAELSAPTEPYAVVISASTTGGMARRMHDDQSFSADRLLTLIDASRVDRRGEVLVGLDEVDANYRRQLADGTETQIELFGEHFSSKAKPPRAVTLGKPHTPPKLKEFLKEFGTNGVLGLNTQIDAGTRPRLVALDTQRVGANGALLKWLDEEIAWEVASAIDHVIYADDEGSKALAERAANKLLAARRCEHRPPITAYREVGSDTLKNAQGVLIVQAVVGDGGLLREISRDLREFLHPDIPRHFLMGAALPQSDETWRRLRQFLVRGSSREYGFSAWLVLPVGTDGTSDAWHSLSTLAVAAQIETPTVAGVAASVVTESIEQAVALVAGAFHGFLPTTKGTPLELSEGFVFFGKLFEGRLKDVPVSATYATVASVLQRARELDEQPINQLKPSGYESVIVSPENFLRFNDNLLQACVIRAAHPSELDYSSSPHLSGLMKEFLLKMFARHEHAYGAAALEFAAALASGRLKLATEDRKEVQKKSVELLAAKSTALLGFICLLPA